MSHRNLLQWQTAAQAEQSGRGLGTYLPAFWPAALLGLGCLLLSPGVLGRSTGLLWLLSPLLAYALSLPARREESLTDSEREASFCRVLLDGGALGLEVPADSEEGRKLTTVRSLGYDPHDRLLNPASSKYVLFDQDEAAMNHVDLDMSALTITRISDGLRLMNLDYAGIAIGCDVAPDGSSICIYGYYTTPRIIRISDPDTLVAKARKKLEREEGNA